MVPRGDSLTWLTMFASATTAVDPLTLANRLRPVLLKLNRDLRREIHSLGVSAGQVALLVQIAHTPGIGVRDLAARERMSAAGMSGHIDRLVASGLVTRTPDTADRRRVGLTLTDEGQRVRRAVKSRRTAWLASRLTQLTPDQLDALDAAIEPLQELIDE
jgi:DNA-binding MarR family transcriptional regulator